jgi:hypothetical protein
MIRERLFRGADIYADFPFDQAKVDMQGWGSDHPVLPWLIGKMKPTLIIEVGSWKGRSAINMARKIESLHIDSEILCIDTWLGSPEHWLGSGDTHSWWDSLRIKNGRPLLYETFLNNVIASKCQKYITPFPITSEAAFVVLQRLSVKAAIIYIDAGHEYESVLRDIEVYWKLLENDGVMVLGLSWLAWSYEGD